MERIKNKIQRQITEIDKYIERLESNKLSLSTGTIQDIIEHEKLLAQRRTLGLIMDYILDEEENK